jgi:hypothetical protein
MSRMEFEPTVPLFERYKTVDASDCAVTWMGTYFNTLRKFHFIRLCPTFIPVIPGPTLLWVSNIKSSFYVK